MRRFGTKKLLLLAWACALAFGLTYQTGEVRAAHLGCGSQCSVACKGHDGCGGYTGGCNCDWICGDGTVGQSRCVL